MGFYAKDLDMPTCCDNCVMYDGWNCPYRHGVVSRYIVPTNTTLPDFCGLVEVNAPHGKLIDVDEALVAMNTWDKFGFTHTGAFVREPVSSDYVPYVHYEDMVKCVRDMPTIIEAEE